MKLKFKIGLSVLVCLLLMETGIIYNTVCYPFFFFLMHVLLKCLIILPVSSFPSGGNLLLCPAVHLEEGQPREPM